MKNFLIITVAALVLVTGAFVSVKYAAAQDADNPMTSLVQRIAQKFGLNESDVQLVFDEHRDEMHTNMQLKFEDRLSQAVTDGKIAEEQKQKIIAKHEELQQKMEETRLNWQNMSDEERQAAKESLRQTHEDFRSELETWASENGIDLSVFPMLMGRGMKMGHHGMMW